MSYSTTPIFPSQAHFQAFPASAAQPASRGPPAPHSSPVGPSSFKAPAHKHAHHLHSIPPREKSTRTLIIDHMLWVHARTRFAQARAELGMTDRTGGPASPHFRSRERPEQYDEEDEVSSDGGDVNQLKARGAGHGDAHSEDEESRMQKQDFALARSLRLRAIALEKVITSMLDQPPPLHPVPVIGEFRSPPGSPKRRESQPLSKASHPHTLPNGVRLRLALGTVINDLFARQAPVAPYRHHHHAPPIVVSNSLSQKESAESLSSDSSPVPQYPSPHPSTSTSQSCGVVAGVLPPSLIPLASISGASGTQPLQFPSAMPASGVQGQRNAPGTRGVWNDRVRAFYVEGADPSTANSPPALRCPRHLHTGCDICVEARQLVKAPGGPAKGRTGVWGGEITSRPPPQIGSGKSMGGSGGGITGWQDGGGIGSGLAHSGINGSVLRRKSKWLQYDAQDAGYAGAGAGNTRLSELIPRFLRLSALVAMELGEELVDDEYERDFQRERSRVLSASPSSPQSPFQARKALSEGEASPLRPSREWYMLFAGLLTRAALEGYLTGGWRGPAAASCLLSVGLGSSDDPFYSDEDEGDLIFEWFDPDDLPTLKEAAQIMFPSLKAMSNGVPPNREDAEAEFEAEMKERLRRFYTIPSLTPDLSTHMEDLAWHYPAEPIERAAVRFCEAVAKWRGKPELETYKKRSRDPATPAMTIESLVHSNPTSPTLGTSQPSLPKSKRPPIEYYFIVPQPLTGRKRQRSTDDGDRFTKRAHGGVVVSAVPSHT